MANTAGTDWPRTHNLGSIYITWTSRFITFPTWLYLSFPSLWFCLWLDTTNVSMLGIYDYHKEMCNSCNIYMTTAQAGAIKDNKVDLIGLFPSKCSLAVKRAWIYWCLIDCLVTSMSKFLRLRVLMQLRTNNITSNKALKFKQIVAIWSNLKMIKM